MHVEAPVRHAGPIQGPDYDFLAGVVAKTPKVCIPAPSMLHFRGGRQALSQPFYPDLEDFYADLAAAIPAWTPPRPPPASPPVSRRTPTSPYPATRTNRRAPRRA